MKVCACGVRCVSAVVNSSLVLLTVYRVVYMATYAFCPLMTDLHSDRVKSLVQASARGYSSTPYYCCCVHA